MLRHQGKNSKIYKKFKNDKEKEIHTQEAKEKKKKTDCFWRWNRLRARSQKKQWIPKNKGLLSLKH